MATKRTTGHEEPRPHITPEAYAAFIGQIELEHIWLLASHVENQAGPEGPRDGVEVQIGSEADWRARDDGFDATQRYDVQFVVGDALVAQVDVTFGLRFTSGQPMTEDIFHLFHDVNLPVNAWPYLREFVSNTTGRMGWLPFTLPALKRGTSPIRPSEKPSVPARTGSRRRSARASNARREMV